MHQVTSVNHVNECSSHAKGTIGNHDHNDGTDESSNHDDDVMVIMWISMWVSIHVAVMFMRDEHDGDVMVIMSI